MAQKDESALSKVVSARSVAIALLFVGAAVFALSVGRSNDEETATRESTSSSRVTEMTGGATGLQCTPAWHVRKWCSLSDQYTSIPIPSSANPSGGTVVLCTDRNPKPEDYEELISSGAPWNGIEQHSFVRVRDLSGKSGRLQIWLASNDTDCKAVPF